MPEPKNRKEHHPHALRNFFTIKITHDAQLAGHYHLLQLVSPDSQITHVSHRWGEFYKSLMLVLRNTGQNVARLETADGRVFEIESGRENVIAFDAGQLAHAWTPAP